MEIPAPIAPSICIEVQSRSNSPAEMIEKRALYFEAGAGELRFFDPSGELDRSIQAPGFPLRIQV